MAIEDFVAFEIGTFYSKDGKCKADADVAGIGVSSGTEPIHTTYFIILTVCLGGCVLHRSCCPHDFIVNLRRSSGRTGRHG